jgi:3-oxoacyl-[acyl-carrier-protein] synthase-3
MHVYITGLSAFLPNAPVTNPEIEKVLGLIGGRPSRAKELILKRNGITSRHYAIDPATGRQTHNNAQLTAEAVRRLAAGGKVDLNAIDLLACGTSSPDLLIPSHAAMVHGELGCAPCEIASTAGVCCSSINALKYAYTSVLAGASRRAVVTGSDLPSAAFHARRFQPQVEACGDKPFVLNFEQEFLRWMLSDGAAALVVERQPRPGTISLRIDWIDLISYAGQLETCMYGGGVKQDGAMRTWREETDLKTLHGRGYLNLTQDLEILMKNMIPVAFKQSVERIVARRELAGERIEWMLPHLSSLLFEQAVHDTAIAAGLIVPKERWFTNLAYKGNTGAAAMFIILEELVSSGRVKDGDRIVCTIPESGRFAFGYIHLTAVAS